MKLQGIYAGLTTPFDHTGAIFGAKMEHNLEKWNRASLAGYVVAGPSGEGPLLAAGERVELWELTAKHAGGRTLIAGIDAQGVLEAACLASRAADLGFAAVLAETPLYDRSGAVQQLYFRSLADRSPLPVVIADRGGLEADALAALCRHPNIAGVVTGDLSRARALAAGGRITVLCGNEQILWESLQAGASGGVLPLSSAAPYATIALWEAFRTREEEAGLDWQARIAHPAECVTTEYGVAGLKHAMDLNGYYGGPPRLPSSVPAPEARQRIAEAFRDLKG